jgi:hypothetical protein
MANLKQVCGTASDYVFVNYDLVTDQSREPVGMGSELFLCHITGPQCPAGVPPLAGATRHSWPFGMRFPRSALLLGMDFISQDHDFSNHLLADR